MMIFSQELRDFIGGRGYEPTAEMGTVIENLGFTWRADYIMRSTRPTVEDADAFNEHCTDLGDKTSTLGCYSSADNRIYVYNVAAEEFDGIKESVLAHEVLHAIYDRLSDSKREELNAELDTFYRAHEDYFGDYMDNYSEDMYFTELHSIIGQRVRFADLSASLQKHYALYFNDQDAVAAYYGKYHVILEEQDAKIDAAHAEIEEMKAILTARRERYHERLDAYEADVAVHNRETENGNWSQARYDSLTARKAALDSECNWINDYVDKYNEKVHAYNSLLDERSGLYGKLDSRYQIEAAETENAD